MRFLRVRNWERWQSYRSDRGQPPWIKVHRQLVQNYEFASLTDAQRWHLVAIWILAASNNGRIPDDANAVQSLCNLDVKPDLTLFLSLQFLEKTGKRRRQRDAKLTPSRTREAEVDTEEEKDPPPKKDPPPEIPSWIPPESWAGYDEMRRKLGRQHPWTDRARALAIGGLLKLRGEGHDIGAVIDQSVMNGWRSFWPVKAERGNGTHRKTRKEEGDELRREWLRQQQAADGVASPSGDVRDAVDGEPRPDPFGNLAPRLGGSGGQPD